jgi:uncharacterized repeat protein (TIGR03803 family)
MQFSLKDSVKTIIALVIFVSASLAGAQTIQTLCSFNGGNGEYPVAGLTMGTDGNFYGTTENGGIYGDGMVFKVTTNGTLTTLVSFNGNCKLWPYAALTLGNDGNFYGTTELGGSNGYGTVFKMTTNGTLTTLVSFDGSNGAWPIAALTLGNDGNFYGTTSYGYGTVFKVTTNGTLTMLVSFNDTNGAEPYNALTLGNDGNFYGTTYQGGDTNLDYGYGVGTVFKVTTNGTLTMLVSFNFTNGAYPQAALTLGTDGNFYGTTPCGGDRGGNGTVFRVTTNGTLTTLYSFTAGSDGGSPNALTLGNDGNFYGTTFEGGSSGGGTVFKVTTNGTLTTLVSFNYTNGAEPYAGLTLGTDGNFYGTTGYGGSSGDGMVFRLLLPPVVRPTLTLQFWSGYPLLSLYGTFGDTYTVEYTTNLAVPNWTPILIVPNLSISPFQMIDPAGVGQPARFYRAVQSQ